MANENEYIRISDLDPIPQDWSQERIAQFMRDGLLPISDTESEITYKVLVGVMLSYAIGKSVTKESISYEFNPNGSYEKDSFCLYERDLYIANEQVNPGAWDSTKWRKIPLTVLINKLALMISLKYNPESTYNKDDFCTNDFVLYKCKEDSVTGTWDSSKWKETNIATELKYVLDYVNSKTKLSDFTDDITQQTFLYNGINPISGAGVYNFGKAVISAQYDPSKTYNKGWICFNAGKIYESLENGVTGAWNSSKWKETTIADSLSTIFENSSFVVYDASYNPSSAVENVFPDASKIDADITNGKHVVIRMVNSNVPTNAIVYYQLLTRLEAYQTSPKRIIFMQSGQYGSAGVYLTASYSNNTWSWTSDKNFPWLTNNDFGNTIATLYNPSSTYSYPTCVIYNKMLYRCNGTNITGDWDSTKWTAIHTMDVFSGSAPGLVPAATSDDANKLLGGDGVWTEVEVYTKSYIDSLPWLTGPSVVIGGREYPVVKIGNQLWIAENLDYKFTKSDTSADWCYYDNNETTYGWTGRKCGLLYNWYAVKDLNDNASTLLPSGWHVPSENEWYTLLDSIGGVSTAGTKLKAANVSWASSWNGTDDYGFKNLPTGSFTTAYGPTFSDIGTKSSHWTSTPAGSDAYYFSMTQNASVLHSNNYKSSCYSIRLVKTLT